jgi:TRAP-type C4-dicarboxylate transport system substrate-binding protein
VFKNKIAAVGTALCMTFAATSTYAQTVTIRYSNWMPATYFAWTEVIQPWFKDIEKVTEGRVKVEILPKVVGSAASQFDVTRDGLADMAWVTAGFTPNRFPSTEFAELPLLSSDAKVHAPVFDRMYRKHLKPLNEFAGVEVLTIFPITPSQIFTRKKPVSDLADMKGLKLRSPTNAITEALNIVGAVPVHKTPAEAYEMLSTGAIDGQITQPNSVVGFNLKELTDHGFLVQGGLANAVCLIAINQAKWNSISEKDRAAIMEVSADRLAAKFGEAWTRADVNALDVLKKSGYVIKEATPEQVTRIRQTLKPIEQQWIAKAKAAKLPDPEAILAEYRQAVNVGQ